MTANGAVGETLKQMEAALGGGASMQALNESLYSYVKNLPSGKKSTLDITNSIWFRDKRDFTVEPAFLQTNADYYGANAYKGAFDNETVRDINSWVKKKTHGLIDKIIDEIPADVLMYLINAVYFEAEWQNIYESKDVRNDEFTAFDGTKKTVKFMHSSEGKFIGDDDGTVGFIKPYAGNHYSFAAFLPDKTTSIADYITSLSGEKFLDMVSNPMDVGLTGVIPKFKYEYEIEMSGALKGMGITEAFDRDTANFSKLGHLKDGNLFIDKVRHKAFIAVDSRGTKAGAVTSVAVGGCSSAEPHVPEIIIKLDRPFVYAIVDNATHLPVFMGAVMKI